MAGPDLGTYLQIRERELESQISNVRGELAPLEAELAQVRKIRSLIADARAAGLTDLASGAVLPEPIEGTFTTAESALRSLQSINTPKSSLEVAAEQLTIKQMTLRALGDHFGDTGATPTELRDYMLTVFHKEVDRNSISPQLTRLREEGMVECSITASGGSRPRGKESRATVVLITLRLFNNLWTARKLRR